MEKLFTRAVFGLSFVLANFGNRRSYNSTESDFFRLQVTSSRDHSWESISHLSHESFMETCNCDLQS